MTKKTCCKCLKDKDASEFTNRTKVKGGKKYLSSECKTCAALRQKARDKTKRTAYKLRMAVLDLIGRKCVHCGFEDERALQIDHIDGNGHVERKLYGGQNMYRHILEVGGVGYQTLCANCNAIKATEDREKRKLRENRRY